MKGIDIAHTMLGWQEVRDNRKLKEFLKSQAKNGDIYVDPANTPWCACFVNGCERKVGKAGNGRQNARSFLTYGTKVKVEDAEKGDIAIFKRGGSSWQGHVTYIEEVCEDDSGNMILKCLGGNQGDAVTYSWYSTDRLLGVRRS